ncbi:hypothetical protein AMELA_G00080550 [Ameiurus melas]|uniref:Uncharacterized protein n=1 Tax=Ameiurus melas TaxID=219545 RepID=A0A7J6AZI0_AMEME|nr:hypothetical protein AMELA_G00080550 [Ameiurus melas]
MAWTPSKIASLRTGPVWSGAVVAQSGSTTALGALLINLCGGYAVITRLISRSCQRLDNSKSISLTLE